MKILKNIILTLIILAVLATPLFTMAEFLAMMQGVYGQANDAFVDLNIKYIKDILLVLAIWLAFSGLLVTGKIRLYRGIGFLNLVVLGFLCGLLLNGIAFSLFSIRIYLPLLLVVVGINYFQEEDYQKIYKTVIWLLIIEILAAFAQLYFNIGLGYSFFRLLKRVMGTFAYPNSFAIFLVLANSLLLTDRGIRARKILIVITSFLILASGSGAGIVLLLMQYFIYFMFIKRRIDPRLRVLFAIAGMLLFVFVAFFLPQITAREGVYSVSGAGRVDILLMEVNRSTPFEVILGKGLGVGSNTTKILSSQGMVAGESEVFIADSLYASLFAQLGLVGLLSWFVFNLYLIYMAFRKKYRLGMLFFPLYLIYNFSAIGFEVFPINWIFPIMIGQLYQYENSD